MTAQLKKDEVTSTLYFSENSNWDDMRFPATAVNPPGLASDPDVDTDDGTFLFGHLALEIIMLVAQLPHGMKKDSIIKPHIHWQSTDDTAGDVLWNLEYQIASIGGNFSGSWTIINDFVPVQLDEDLHMIHNFDPIDLTGYGLSSVIKFKLSRGGQHSSDTYDADAKLLEFDFHYEKDSVGSGQELIK